MANHRRSKHEHVWDGRGARGEDMRYSIIPGRAASDPSLTCVHFRILAHLGRFNQKKGWCRLNQTELAVMFGVRRQAINKAIGELEEWGYISRRSQEETGESFCLYRTIIDAPEGEGVSATADTPRRKGVSGKADTSVRSRRTPVSPRKDTHYDHVDHIESGSAPKAVEQAESSGAGLIPFLSTDGSEALEADAEQGAQAATKAPEPMWRGKPLFSPGTGNWLIPFDGVDVSAMAEANAEQEARAATGIRADYIPGSPAFLAECHRLCVDPAPIAKRFLAEVESRIRRRDEKIRRPTAYLIRMVHEVAAEKNGLTAAQVADASRQHKAHQARRDASTKTVDLGELQQKCAAARPKNCAALVAALNGGRV